MNNINIQKMKLFILQKRYSEICNSVRMIQEHSEYLYKFNLIEYLERNSILSNLFEISKSINSKYNEYINNEIEGSDDLDSIEIMDTYSNDSKVLINMLIL